MGAKWGRASIRAACSRSQGIRRAEWGSKELHEELRGKPGVGRRSLQSFGQSGQRDRTMWHVSLVLSILQLVQKPLQSISKERSRGNSISMLLYGRLDLLAEARLLPYLSTVRIWLVGCCPGCCSRIQQWFLRTAAIIRHNLRTLGSFPSEHPSM